MQTVLNTTVLPFRTNGQPALRARALTASKPQQFLPTPQGLPTPPLALCESTCCDLCWRFPVNALTGTLRILPADLQHPLARARAVLRSMDD